MLKLSILILLCLTSNNISISSDYSLVTVQFPPYSQPISQINYTKSNPDPINTYANWIWINGTSRMATFEYLFNNSQPANDIYNMYVKANDTFYAYLNGATILTGSKFERYQRYISLSCGLNNLTFKVENTNPNATSSGLVFSFETYSSNTACSSNGYFNYETCSCQCSGNFGCSVNQKLLGYPICGCKCANQGALSCNANNQYYDGKTCGCKCRPTYCRPGYILDLSTCSCKCKAATCSNGTTWNINMCRCV